MTDIEARETIRQAMTDWNAATDEQRAEALMIAEHRAEHFDDIVMDCPLCVAEWQAIGGKA